MAKQNAPQNQQPQRRIPGWLIVSFAVVLVLVAVSMWGEFAPAPRGEAAGFKNLLLFTFDTTRADHIGAYGYPKAKTPNIDRLAAEGVLFERCMSVAPITLPSHTSILTGIYPHHHGVRNNGTHNVSEEVVTLAERLDEQGFATGAVISALVLDSRYGLDQGFHNYDDNLANAEKAPLFMYRETKALDSAQRAIRWLQDRADERWFLWVHFFDPHANYDPPEPFKSACEDPYDSEIHYADAGMGEVLESLRKSGDLEQTLVVMTSDHGESLGEHGEATHSLFIYDATTRVPLVLWHPGLVKGKRIRLPVSSVDIVPTVLEVLGLHSAEAEIDGISLADVVLETKVDAPDRGLYQESMNPYYNHGWSDMRAVRDKRHRYIKAPIPELYDLFRDGRELVNLHADEPELVGQYSAMLKDLLGTIDRDTAGADIRSMSPEERQALAELGYVWEQDGSLPDPDADLPDPKEKIGLWERSQRAHDLVRQKRLPEAEEALKRVLDEDPNATLTQSALVGVLLQLGKREEAYEVLRHVVSGPAPPVTTVLRLAALEHEDGIPTWEQHLQAAKEIAPKDPLPWVRQGDWAQEDGLHDEAIAAYRQALVVDDRCAQAYIGLGNTYHRDGNEEESEKALRKAAEVDPLAFEAFYNLGVVCEAQDRPAEAEQWYLRALNLQEDHILTMVNLANLYYQVRKIPQAEGLYLKALEKEPKDFNANFNLGILYLRTGRPELAKDNFRTCIDTDPSRPQPWKNYLFACRGSKANDEMMQAAERILQLEPENLDIRIFQAVGHERLGNPAEAERVIREVQVVNAEHLFTRSGRDRELRPIMERMGLELAPLQAGPQQQEHEPLPEIPGVGGAPAGG